MNTDKQLVRAAGKAVLVAWMTQALLEPNLIEYREEVIKIKIPKAQNNSRKVGV